MIAAMISGQAAHAILAPGRYHLYCTPKSRLLLAIEPAVATGA
jgi:hypothetical protein